MDLNSSAISDGGSADLLRLLRAAIIEHLGSRPRVVDVFSTVLAYFLDGADAHGIDRARREILEDDVFGVRPDARRGG